MEKSTKQRLKQISEGKVKNKKERAVEKSREELFSRTPKFLPSLPSPSPFFFKMGLAEICSFYLRQKPNQTKTHHHHHQKPKPQNNHPALSAREAGLGILAALARCPDQMSDQILCLEWVRFRCLKAR